ncbi:MAG: hypothetical protein KKD59_04870 [Acidobacteria bacterium]|nr:hypothetical protein [Acidobacteriota bacterium]MBU4329983.1 hypothetical protein [Acidobacteriota bacterium]MCG2816692.1 hypothetical protein [Candidatus Aminicenantes bacterium]
MKKNRKRQKGNRLLVVTVLTALILITGAVGVQAGRCELALDRCMHDPLLMNMIGSLFCLNGYVFCKTYIEG